VAGILDTELKIKIPSLHRVNHDDLYSYFHSYFRLNQLDPMLYLLVKKPKSEDQNFQLGLEHIAKL